MIDYSVCSLYSGSTGNSVLIRSPEASVLIDAGKNAKALCSALGDVGLTPDRIDSIFITHEHTDHISALPVLSHKYRIPIHIILKSAMKFENSNDRALCECLILEKKVEYSVKIKDMTVTSFPTSHDSMASCGYRIDINGEGGNVSIGYATDIGYITDEITNALTGCETVIIEANHDPEMLADGPYPPELKARIRSRRGHLSNTECAAFVSDLCETGTKNILLAHLSEVNNTPELALCEVTHSVGSNINIRVAAPDRITRLVDDGCGVLC